jgi:hypothetical protein
MAIAGRSRSRDSVAALRQSHPKMLQPCYKNAALNPLVANTGVIHKRAALRPLFRTFFVGGEIGS